MKAIIVNKLTSAGCKFVFWVADWFAMLNNKLDGDLEKIRTVGEYMIEIWKACGMNLDAVTFKWSSEEINAQPDKYWMLVMDIARHNNLPRILRCATIMGRKETDDLATSQVFYPCMQCADIFFLEADICQLGMDQRKVNMLAREYCDIKGIKKKPVILSHHMIKGLKQGQEKMSKSDPDSAIFMEDTEEDVNKKIRKAYCPPNIVADNPCMDYFQHIIFRAKDEVVIECYGGEPRRYTSFACFANDYENGILHPGDVKKSLALLINELIEPVRTHFRENENAKRLLESVRSFKITK